jgi:hypothetical protein
MNQDAASLSSTTTCRSGWRGVKAVEANLAALEEGFIQDPASELRRIPLPRTPVNKGERMSCWENTGRDEGSVPIMGTTLSVGKREVEGE